MDGNLLPTNLCASYNKPICFRAIWVTLQYLSGVSIFSAVFELILECLAILIRQSNDVTGITLLGFDYKLFLYAKMDISAILDDLANSLTNIQAAQHFAKYSSKINWICLFNFFYASRWEHELTLN